MQTAIELLATAKAICCQTLAADLAGSPLYVISPSEGSLLDKDTLGASDALFVDGLDSMFRPQLEKSGEWKGPGVAIIVDPTCPAADVLDAHNRLRWLTGLMLHELCHWLDGPLRKPKEVCAAKAIGALSTLKLNLRGEQRDPVDAVFDPTAQYQVHGESFTRLAVHAWHRACVIGGLPLGIEWLSIGSAYPGLFLLDTPRVYVDSLRDELATFPLAAKLRPLSEHFELFDAPPAYVELWRDTARRLDMFKRRLHPETTETHYAPISR